jgi:hypothetical protein
VTYVRFFWLDDGALPLFQAPDGGLLHYMAGGGDDEANTRLRWQPARFGGNIAIIPLAATTLDALLKFIEEPAEVEGETLYVAIRSSWRVPCAEEDGGFLNELIVAVAIVPGQVEGAIEYPWHFEPLHQLVQLCTLADIETEPDDPILRTEWLKMGELRGERRKYREVQDRAKALLMLHLDEEQLKEFKKWHRFRVRTDGFTYLIMYGVHGNVFRIAEGEDEKVIPLINYCHCPQDEELPVYDQMLAQKILIELAPDNFFAVANATVLDPDEC